MRLLLVEDERSLSRAVTEILKKNNYAVDAASSRDGRSLTISVTLPAAKLPEEEEA